MAAISNTAEGGTQDVEPTTANTGGLSGDAANLVTVGSGNAITFSTTNPAHGNMSYQFAYGTTAPGSLRWNLSEAGRVVHCFYVRLSSLPAAFEYLGAIRHSAGNMCIATINASGKFVMQNSAGSAIAASAAPNTFPVNQYVRVEIAVTKGTTTTDGIIEYAYYLGDATTAVYSWSSNTQNTGTNNVNQVVIGRNATGTESRTVWYDTITARSQSSGWVGPQVAVTSIINTAEGGTNGTVPTTANTGGASGDAAAVVTVGTNNAITFSNENPAHGTLGYKMEFGTATGGSLRWNFSEPGRLVHSFYVMVESLPTSFDYLAGIRHSAGYMCIVGINSSGKFIMQDSTGSAIGASVADDTFPTNQYVRVEVAVRKGTTASDGLIEYAYYIGDATIPEMTWSSSAQNTGTNDVAQVIIGRNTGAAQPNTMWYDTIRTQNLASGWIGPYSTQNTIPVARLGSAVNNIEPWTLQVVDGSASSDSDGGTVVDYTFRQISGASVVLSGSGSTRTYKAPGTLAGTTLVFGLVVTDNQGADSTEANVSHTVLQANERAIISGAQVPIEVQSVQS